MILCVRARTDIPDLIIDFIEVKIRSGKTVSLTWDESDAGVEGGILDGRYKGVYLDEEYANGRLEELYGMQVEYVELYSESGLSGTFSIISMLFEDGNSWMPLSAPLYRAERRSDEKTENIRRTVA